MQIRVFEFNRDTDNLEIGFIPTEGKGKGAIFKLPVPADIASQICDFTEFCRRRFSAREVTFDPDALSVWWEKHENEILLKIGPRPFRFGDGEKAHVTGQLICPACHTGCGIPCLEIGCLGTIHIDLIATGPPRGRDNTTPYDVVSKCDRCGGSAESTIRLGELLPMIRNFGSATAIANATGKEKTAIVAGLRELRDKIRARGPRPI